MDNVNHPSHYRAGKYECIEVMLEVFGMDAVKGFCLCNAFKYLYRCGRKNDTPLEDVQKAEWYLHEYGLLSFSEKRGDGGRAFLQDRTGSLSDGFHGGDAAE